MTRLEGRIEWMCLHCGEVRSIPAICEPRRQTKSRPTFDYHSPGRGVNDFRIQIQKGTVPDLFYRGFWSADLRDHLGYDEDEYYATSQVVKLLKAYGIIERIKRGYYRIKEERRVLSA